MNTSEALRKAADVLAERGHTKGAYVDSEGRCCAQGAMRIACDIINPEGGSGSSNFRTLAAYRTYAQSCAMLEIWVERNTGYSGVLSWNDDRTRTGTEVERALREAADEAERAAL